MNTNGAAGPWGRYCRRIDGADFSLEANTEATPEPGRFYVLQEGRVLHQSEDLETAVVAYKALCREYWERHLQSDVPSRRVASAWGLLSLDPDHPAATAVIREEASPADCKRLEQNRNRRRFENRRQNFRRAKSG